MLSNNLLKPGILSTLICLVSFMTVRIVNILILAVFLHFNDIGFEYSLFHVEYIIGGQGNWTEGKVLFIYILPYLIFALLGIYLPHILRRKNNVWLQLVVTWLSFHMMLLVISGLATGLFQYRGVGVALEWLFVNLPVRIIGVLIIITIMLIAARRFAWYFLRKVPDRIYHDDFEHRYMWSKKIVLIPFIISFAFIMPLAELETLLEFIFSFTLGLIFIAVIYRTIPSVYIPD